MNNNEYFSAATSVRELHILRDPELVAAGAAHHGVRVTVGKLFEPMSPGDYNERLPHGDEWEQGRMKGVRGVAKFCIDYRQSYNLGSLVERDGLVSWADAGGPVQPNKEILRVDMGYWEVLLMQNIDIIAYLFAHPEICGGANHYTDGRMGRLRGVKFIGAQLEKSVMKGFVNDYERELRRLKRGMDIRKGLVDMVGNKYSGVSFFK